MKKSVVIIAVLIVLLNISCKKNAESQNSFQSYLRFKLDNVQIECNAHIKATLLPPPINQDVIITISGNWAGGSVSLILNEGQVLTPGTYTFLPGKIRSGELWIYTLPTGYYSGLGGGVFDPLVYGSGQITITEINPEFVKGSFQCVLTNAVIPQTLKILTGGEFHIKRG